MDKKLRRRCASCGMRTSLYVFSRAVNAKKIYFVKCPKCLSETEWRNKRGRAKARKAPRKRPLLIKKISKQEYDNSFHKTLLNNKLYKPAFPID